MKILVILNDLDIGGAQNYTISLMNEFVKKGNDVVLIVLSEILYLKQRISQKVELKIWSRKSKLDILVLYKIRKEIKTSKYDGIISSYIVYQKLATLYLFDNPITIYPIHTTIERDRKSFMINFCLFALKRKNEVFLTSIYSQTMYLLSMYKLPTNFFKEINNGIDTKKFTLKPESFNRTKFLECIGVKPTHKIILMVAGFREEKRHLDAINAFKLLLKEMNDVSLVCVGDKRENNRDELQKYLDVNKITNIILLTSSQIGDIREYYWSSDIFTLTSDKVETFPISALEAMASGLPVVLTNVGGAKDIIIESRNGYLVEPNSVCSIKEGWKKAFFMKAAGKSCEIREMVKKKYSIENSATDYLKLIMEKNVNQ